MPINLKTHIQMQSRIIDNKLPRLQDNIEKSIQGKIEISTLSIERARRTGAVTSYEQARVTLHNSVILLEMLTNIKIIKEK